MLKTNQMVNEVFAPLWQSEARYSILLGGRGAGRSTAVSQFILSKLLDKDYFRAAIMREVHSDIRSTAWKEILDRVEEQKLQNTIEVAHNEMEMRYAGNIIHAHGFRQSSGQQSAKLKSLANYNIAWIEEAIETGEIEFMKLDDSLRTTKAPIKIILSLNPPAKDHWIIKRWFDLEEHPEAKGYFIPHLKKGITDAVHIGGNYRVNINNLSEHTIKNYQAYKELKPDYYWQEIEGLVPEVIRGKIYHGWEKINSIPDEARLMRFGIDFGFYPDSAAVVAVWYWNGSYIIDEVVYGNYLSNEFLAGKIRDYGTALTVADSAEPKSIEEMKKYKIRIEGAEKGKGSVEYGIKTVSGKKIFVTAHSKNIWKDYETYAMKENKDGEALGTPAHPGSDGMDAVRYAFVGLESSGGGIPHVFSPAWKSYGRVGSGVKVFRG